jgi:hypothetical protein
MTSLPLDLTAQRVRTPSRRRAWLLTVAGGLGAAVFLNFILGFFVAGWYYPAAPVRTIRQFTEGTATSHFLADGFGTYGNRLTGNTPVPNAPTLLLVGDSHLVQEAVPDTDTMGAVIENLSRAQGRPVNVRQYGWYSTAAPTYLANAPALLKSLDPQLVVVVLNSSDFGREALEGWYWQMRINSDLTFRLIDVRVPKTTGGLARIREFVGRSPLMLSLRRRAVLVFQSEEPHKPQSAAPTSDPIQSEVPLVIPASVKGLKAVYDNRLLIAYTPFCRETCASDPDEGEARLLEACREQDVKCISTRADMVAEIQSHHRLLRGFHNTAPGEGHLNEVGLRVVGTAIWRAISVELH